MSPRQIALNSDLKRLQDDGLEVEVKNGYLLVHSVPYVNSRKEVALGTVVTDLAGNLEELLPPRDHQVWFAGEYPCHYSGDPIEAIRCSSEARQLWEGFWVQHHFSNKLFGTTNYPDYHSKMTNYIRIISDEARVIDPAADPRTFKVIAPGEEESVFKYHDSASSRADILALSAKLGMENVAIVGLGGTGSYVLDLVAKAPTREIHLFDGDLFLQHNAFRAPGAASEQDLGAKRSKVSFFAEVYGAMRHGLFPHPEYVTEENLDLLSTSNFVFLCVDKGPVRGLIGSYLQSKGIPFVDVGMDLLLTPGGGSIFGTCRVTFSSPEKSEHFTRHAPTADDAEEGLYRKNIQVADLNALNAALAVIKWKQYCGFYQDLVGEHQTTFSINSHSLTRDEMAATQAPA